MQFVSVENHLIHLYDENLATYTADEFDQDAAVGFIKLWGLPSQVNAQVWDKLDKENNLFKANYQIN